MYKFVDINNDDDIELYEEKKRVCILLSVLCYSVYSFTYPFTCFLMYLFLCTFTMFQIAQYRSLEHVPINPHLLEPLPTRR